MSELWQLSALELAGKIRTGEATSREVLQAHIDRVEAVDSDALDGADAGAGGGGTGATRSARG